VHTVPVTKIFTDSAGFTRFADITLPLDHSTGEIGSLSHLFPGTGVMLRYTPGSYNFDWHQAPREQFIVNLDGDLDVSVSRCKHPLDCRSY
jgi:hypothetical protein